MTKFPCFFILFLCFSAGSFAQTVSDSLPRKTDSVPAIVPTPGRDSIRADSAAVPRVVKKHHAIVRTDSSVQVLRDSAVIKPVPLPSVDYGVEKRPEAIDSNLIILAAGSSGTRHFFDILSSNPYYNFLGPPTAHLMEWHQQDSYEGIFYLLLGLLFYFALVKLLFGKYLSNLFTLFFRISMRQQQIREQVLQSPLPSLLLNILFIFSGALYASFIIRYYGLAENIDFWLLLIDSMLGILLIYLTKFMLLKVSGWIFNIDRATDRYIFIIFLTNKILAVFLLPFLIVISFSGPVVKSIMVTSSLTMVLIFFVYRFMLSYTPIRKEIKVNGLHFFLYLCAFEIAPLLLIYKVLLSYLEKAY